MITKIFKSAKLRIFQEYCFLFLFCTILANKAKINTTATPPTIYLYLLVLLVASFLLFRMDKHLANLEEGIRRMNETLAKQVNH